MFCSPAPCVHICMLFWGVLGVFEFTVCAMCSVYVFFFLLFFVFIVIFVVVVRCVLWLGAVFYGCGCNVTLAMALVVTQLATWILRSSDRHRGR